jgi:hypothetical protein
LSGAARDMRTTIREQAENELYERAGELVEAAAAVRRAAGRPGAADAVQAVPAVLGCMQDAIRDLNLAAVALERAAAEAVQARGRESDDRRRVIGRMRRGFQNLAAALDDAQQASGASRALVARALAVAGRRGRA